MNDVIRKWDVRKHKAVDEKLMAYHKRMLRNYENFINRLSEELIEKHGYSEDVIMDMLDKVVED